MTEFSSGGTANQTVMGDSLRGVKDSLVSAKNRALDGVNYFSQTAIDEKVATSAAKAKTKGMVREKITTDAEMKVWFYEHFMVVWNKFTSTSRKSL
jgi:hypothetical protein